MGRQSVAMATVMSLFASVAALVLFSHGTAGAVEPRATSRLTVVSAEGDPVGEGQTWAFDNRAADIGLSGDEGAVRFGVQYYSYYGVSLSAPAGRRLATGTYRNARRFGYSGSHPGLEVDGQGRGCNTLTGSFAIRSIVTNQFGLVTALDASFVQYCGDSTAPLVGRLQYHAVQARTLTSSHPVTVEGQPTTLTASAHAGTSVAFYDGRRRLGRAKAASDGLARYTTAHLSRGGHTLTARVGAVGSTPVRQQVQPKLTSFRYSSIGGDPISNGASGSYTPSTTKMVIYGTTKLLTISVTGPHDWTVYVKPPVGARLRATSYPSTTLDSSRTAAGVTVGGGRTSCSSQRGSLTVTKLRADGDGTVVSVALSFVVYCDGAKYPFQGFAHLADGGVTTRS